MKIVEFEWDEGNVVHLELGHGINLNLGREEIVALIRAGRRKVD